MTQQRDVAAATEKMVALLEVVAPKVLADTFFFYRKAPRQNDEGRDKYTGILYRVRGANGTFHDHVIGTLADQAKSETTVENKFFCTAETGNVTSIEGRDPNRKPPWWGGVVGDDGITGGTELQDHLLVCYAQRFSGLITEEECDALTRLEHPGIKASIADSVKHGFSAGGYLSLRNSVEGYFRTAVPQVKAAA